MRASAERSPDRGRWPFLPASLAEVGPRTRTEIAPHHDSASRPRFAALEACREDRGPTAMSMKRTKQRSTGSSRNSSEDDSPAWGKPADPEPSWADVESKPDDSFVPFVVSS